MIWHQYDLLLIFTLVLVATHLPDFIVITPLDELFIPKDNSDTIVVFSSVKFTLCPIIIP